MLSGAQKRKGEVVGERGRECEEEYDHERCKEHEEGHEALKV